MANRLAITPGEEIRVLVVYIITGIVALFLLDWLATKKITARAIWYLLALGAAIAAVHFEALL